jgi:type IV secretory pathway VirB3-like protein
MTDDDAIADRLLLPPCRPVMRAGLPLSAFYRICCAWGLSLIMFGALITGTGVAIAVWVVLKAAVAHDFNIVSVATVYLKTKFIATRSLIWFVGVTLDPNYGPRLR